MFHLLFSLLMLRRRTSKVKKSAFLTPIYNCCDWTKPRGFMNGQNFVDFEIHEFVQCIFAN